MCKWKKACKQNNHSKYKGHPELLFGLQIYQFTTDP